MIRIDLLNGLGFLRLLKWNLQMECAALAKFTLHPNLATMSFRNRFDNGETKTRAALRQRFAMGASIELFKQTRQVAFWNPDTAILNCKRQCRRRSLELKHDLPAFRRILDRIFNKVVDCLVQQ